MENYISTFIQKQKYPGAEVISFDDFKKLICLVEESKAQLYPDYFLKFLKLNCKLNELISLVKLGAEKKDCFIDQFEEMDARHVGSSVASLQWLAAKALAKHQISVIGSPTKLKEVVEASKLYVNKDTK